MITAPAASELQQTDDSSVNSRSSTRGDAAAQLSIIIVSFNTRELTLACLRSVQRYEPTAEVIVIDNASSDGSANAIAAQFPEVTLLRLAKNVGFGRANTLGLQYTTSEIIVLLNSDAVVCDYALSRCAKRLRNDQTLGAVTPRLIGVDGIEQETRHAVPDFSSTLQRAMWGRPMVSRDGKFWIPGTCLVLKRIAVEQAGGLFDPELFMYWEDADLCARLKRAKFGLSVVKDAQVIHHGGASGGGPNCTASARLHAWYTFGRHFWYRRHRPRWEGVCLWLLEFADAFRCMGRAILRRSRRQEMQFGFTLLTTLLRVLSGRPPSFAVSETKGDHDSELIDEQFSTPRHQSHVDVSDIGIVVIGRNEGERLCRCLESVSTENCPIVYVDSGSSDGSQQLAMSKGVTLVELDDSIPFTAARARNAGIVRLQHDYPQVEYVQFIDGDCELASGWLNSAKSLMALEKRCAVVCGVLNERHPERSIYNRLCQLEWQRSTGLIDACGGIFLGRLSALAEAGLFDETLIAGEEPELCFRLRSTDWEIRSIARQMAIHDANITQFHQWWKRAVRSGTAYCDVYLRHRRSPEQFRRREVWSILFWGLLVPVFALAGAWHTSGVTVLLSLLAYIRLYRKVRRGRQAHGDRPTDNSMYSRFVVIGKFAQAVGVIRCLSRRVLRLKTQIIEYKRPAD